MGTMELLRNTEVRLNRRHVVVCVDDEPDILAAIRRLLEDEPYELITKSDPDEVLMLVVQRPVSLILADQRMPGISGTTLLDIVQRRSPSTVRAMITGQGDARWISRAVNENRIARLILKPWDDADLKSSIRRLLQQQEAETDEARRRAQAGSIGDSALLHDEFVARINCTGKTAAGLMERILPLLRKEAAACDHFVLLLEEVPRLVGSVMPFLTTLFGQLLSAGTRTCVIDRSGYASALAYIAGGELEVSGRGIEAPCAQKPRRVLVVERAEGSLAFVRTVLSSAGHAWETARTAAEARRRWGSRPFDLVLHDLNGDSGLDTLSEVESAGRSVPLMSVSVSPAAIPDADCARLTLRRRISASYCLSKLIGANRRK